MRYIRYEVGGEELYDHDTDPLEWKNVADDARWALVKVEHARWLPKHNRVAVEASNPTPGKNKRGKKQ